MSEHWKPIVGWEDIYAVSNFGRIKRTNNTYHKVYNRILKLKRSKAGYLSLILYRGPIEKDTLVHRAVMAAFVGPAPEGTQVNHKDGNKANNTLGNLEYLTPRQNMQHAADIGLRPRGEEVFTCKLNPILVREIRSKRQEGMSLTSLANQYGVHFATIARIALRVTWKHVV